MIMGYTRFPNPRMLTNPTTQPKKNDNQSTTIFTRIPSSAVTRPSSKISNISLPAPNMDTLRAAMLTNMVEILSIPRVSTVSLRTDSDFLSTNGGTLGIDFCGVVIFYFSHLGADFLLRYVLPLRRCSL